ncbi:FAD-dependent oxidoreductase [Thermomonas sp.]|uniref:FAD-dependent oxidoreductase n=1 Tax=Thermomonas sp. TaxID=1971895 RepID=UPI002BEBC2B4|nr:FAD-dependent oxidoreductase [Thermomonas sp.]HRO62692.1 FAD-dependent oxidoreductase [Thermomonas sp.]
MAANSDLDFTQGVALSSIPETGVLSGHVGDAPVLLARVQGQLHAVSASCTHYGGPLGEGLRVGDEIRCPWHHACFSLRTGQALKAPAFAPLACWTVEVEGDRAYVRSAQDPAPAPAPTPTTAVPGRVLIVGGGAAAFACAQRLRERGFPGSVTLLSADADPPCDRPNLSKDYLAGTADEAWIPLQAPEFYTDNRIDLHLNCKVTAIDADAHRVTTAAGEHFDYDALLLATGAEPNHLPLPGFDLPNVYALRSQADSRALLAGIEHAKAVAIVGAGFIGLEAAGALRSRGLAVHVIAPEALPLARIVGDTLAHDLLKRHQDQGVQFHLQAQTQSFDGKTLTLADGSTIDADAVLVGVGVKPRTALAQAAGLAVDNGILVDPFLRTSAAGIYAAGDVASYPHGGGRARVEHWVHAERMGQCVADNLLGAARAFDDPPFFWTHHYGTDLRYLGHGRGWTSVELDGAPADNDCLARYYRDGALIAAAAIGRDRQLLELQAQLQ